MWLFGSVRFSEAAKSFLGSFVVFGCVLFYEAAKGVLGSFGHLVIWFCSFVGGCKQQLFSFIWLFGSVRFFEAANIFFVICFLGLFGFRRLQKAVSLLLW